VLTVGGEQVVLPFVQHHGDQSHAPALTLDRLAEAFAHLGEPSPVTDSAPSAVQATEGQQAEPARQQAEPARQQQPAAAEKDYSDHTEEPRARRPRRNRSASRAQGAANATSVEHHEAVPTAAVGHTHAAKAPEPAKAPVVDNPAATNAPIILGVGVPASEL
jgi:ribonuclease E